VFGAPIAHEDDPERAVRAALAIRDWAAEQEGLELRVAVNTGEALVTLDSRPEQGEGMVAGDVVNTAARLQSAAPTNGILVGETTYRATRERIDYGEHEPVAAKGVAARRPDSPRTPHRGRRRLRRACGDRAGQKSRMPRGSVCRRSGILGACSGAGDSFSTIVRAVAFSCRPLLR
jgi:class 3 adenylate cyclase